MKSCHIAYNFILMTPGLSPIDEALLYMKEFTSDIKELFQHIDGLDCLESKSETFDMSQLFDIILDKVM